MRVTGLRRTPRPWLQERPYGLGGVADGHTFGRSGSSCDRDGCTVETTGFATIGCTEVNGARTGGPAGIATVGAGAAATSILFFGAAGFFTGALRAVVLRAVALRATVLRTRYPVHGSLWPLRPPA